MGWNEVDNKHKKHTDALDVACTEKYERDYLKKIIKEEYSYLTDATIENAIIECCKSLQPPRSRDKFMACLKQRLGVG